MAMSPSPDGHLTGNAGLVRLRIAARGAVQGVGFRPFVHRLACELGISGWVCNSLQGASIEAEGAVPQLEVFLARLHSEKPPPCSFQGLECTWLDAVGHVGFSIQASDHAGSRTATVLPDIVTCAECRREVLDPANRRYLYPFTNCTHCGPRYSIIEGLPYDRPRTSMRKFSLCEQCQAEYENPVDRRFHAQPNACPTCGPHLEFWDRNGRILATHRQALVAAVEALRHGSIVAVKGLGGFQLMVTALCEATVRGLRLLKHREEKPFAVMFPSLAAIAPHCELSPAEERLLVSPEGPIVLLRRRQDLQTLQAIHAAVVPSVAPGNPCLGAMLPTTPLHLLLLHGLGIPVVSTSGNLTDEPICIDEREALTRLRGIAEFFLVHDRPIVRQVDDSVARVVLGREQVLRRARGYAPAPLELHGTWPMRDGAQPPPAILAMGAHFKNTVALTVGNQIVASQHIGDLETEPAFDALRRVSTDLQHLYGTRPVMVVADLHPDYLSSQLGAHLSETAEHHPGFMQVQHHYAHVLAGMLDNRITPPCLGVAWDGTGLGIDGKVWGGEFLSIGTAEFTRMASLRPFLIPGGDKVAREPRRSALGVLHELLGDALWEQQDLAPVRSFAVREQTVLRRVFESKLNTQSTTSAGRLFDAAASLLGVRQLCRHEAQAAMDLEHLAAGQGEPDGYPMPLSPVAVETARGGDAACELDWRPMMLALIADARAGIPVGRLAARFHRSLADGIAAVASQSKQQKIVLTGGCFQNRLLLELTVQRLRETGLQPYWHQRIPTNDGGIAIGQVAAALISPYPHPSDVPRHSR